MNVRLIGNQQSPTNYGTMGSGNTNLSHIVSVPPSSTALSSSSSSAAPGRILGKVSHLLKAALISSSSGNYNKLDDNLDDNNLNIKKLDNPKEANFVRNVPINKNVPTEESKRQSEKVYSELKNDKVLFSRIAQPTDDDFLDPTTTISELEGKITHLHIDEAKAYNFDRMRFIYSNKEFFKMDFKIPYEKIQLSGQTVSRLQAHYRKKNSAIDFTKKEDMEKLMVTLIFFPDNVPGHLLTNEEIISVNTAKEEMLANIPSDPRTDRIPKAEIPDSVT